jgi:hypothetical protein
MRLLIVGTLLNIVVFAQPPDSGSSYAGQSWVGLLVSATCDTSHVAKRSAIENEANLTTSDRTTTPAIDASGTRGQATAPESGSTMTPHNAVPKTGDIREAAATSDPGWKTARKQAASLPAACGVDTSTTRFSLILPDGRALRFDDLANQGIVKQLKANDRSHKSILRVQATGKLQHGEIALDSILL